MEDILSILRSLLTPTRDNLPRYIDILVVSFVLYRVLLLVRKRRAFRILLGIVFYLIFLQVSAVLKLDTLHWVLDRCTVLGPVALVILFLPELRQTIEELGRVGSVSAWRQRDVDVFAEQRTVVDIVAAASDLASQKTGALIVIQRSQSLEEISSNGIAINADLSHALLSSIFYGENPLHDGAAVIREHTIVAAACRLPLSESNLDRHLHMRHRAAIGISEQYDCIAVVVSEERGSISIAHEGALQKLGGAHELDAALRDYLRAEPSKTVRNKNWRVRLGSRREEAKVEEVKL